MEEDGEDHIEEIWSEELQKPYWFNKRTQEVLWEKPQHFNPNENPYHIVLRDTSQNHIVHSVEVSDQKRNDESDRKQQDEKNDEELLEFEDRDHSIAKGNPSAVSVGFVNIDSDTENEENQNVIAEIEMETFPKDDVREQSETKDDEENEFVEEELNHVEFLEVNQFDSGTEARRQSGFGKEESFSMESKNSRDMDSYDEYPNDIDIKINIEPIDETAEIQEYEADPEFQYAKKLATIFHYLLNECELQRPVIQKTGGSFSDQFAENFQTSFRKVEMDIDNGKEDQSASDSKSGSKRGSLKQNSHSFKHNHLRTETMFITSRANLFMSNDSGFSSEKNIQLGSQPDLTIIQPIMTLISANSLELVTSEDFILKYHEHFTDLSFRENELDLELLSILRQMGISFEWISEHMSTLDCKQFIGDSMATFLNFTTDLLEKFNDETGLYFYGKIKAHLVFWRAFLSGAFVDMPYLFLIDNIIAFLVNFMEYPVKPFEIKSEDIDLDDFNMFYSMPGTIGDLIRKTDREESAFLQSFQENLSSFHSNSSKVHRETYLEKRERIQHTFTGLALFFITMIGLGLTWGTWNSASSLIITSSSSDICQTINNALNSTASQYSSTPLIVMSVSQTIFDVSSFNASTIIVDAYLEAAEQYFFEMVYLFNISALFLAVNDSSVLGCFHTRETEFTEEEWYFLMNNGNGSLYKKNFTVDHEDSNILFESDYVLYMEDFDVTKRAFYVTGLEASEQYDGSDDLILAWTNVYAYINEINGVSLASPYFVDGTFQGVFGLDLTTIDLNDFLLLYLLEDFASYASAFAYSLDDGSVYFGFGESGSFTNASVLELPDSRAQTVMEDLIEEYGDFSSVQSTDGEVSNEFTDFKNVLVYISTYETEELNLTLVSIVDQNEYSTLLGAYNIGSTFVTIFAVSVIIVFSWRSFVALHPHVTVKTCMQVCCGRKQKKQNLPFLRPSKLATPKVSSAHDSELLQRDELLDESSCIYRFSRFLEVTREWFLSFRNGIKKFFSTLFGIIWTVYSQLAYSYGVLLVCLCLLTVWIIWAAASSFSIEEAAQRYLDQALHVVVADIESILENPTFINGVNEIMYTTGQWSGSDEDIEVRDRTFQQVMRKFVNDDGSFVVDGMYVGLEADGLFSGAQQYEQDDANISVVVLASDSGNDYCYTKYLTVEHDDETASDYLTRNTSLVTFTSPGCLYDPRLRNWYLAAVSNGGLVWSDVYPFVNGYLGVTLAQPFYNEFGSLIGVFGADLQLTYLSSVLGVIDISDTRVASSASGIAKSEQFVMTTDGNVVASSTGEVSIVNDGNVETLNATSVSDVSLAETALSILLYYNDSSFEEFDGIIEVKRPLEDPLTYITEIRQNETQLNWIMAITVDSDAYFGALTDARAITFLFSGAAAALLLYVSSLGFKRIDEFNIDEDDDDPFSSLDKEDEEDEELDDSSEEEKAAELSKRIMEQIQREELGLGDADPHARITLGFDKTDLDFWRKEMDFIVKQDLLKGWFEILCKRIGLENYSPVPSGHFVQECIRKARFHIRTSEKNRDVLYIILLNSLNQHPFVYNIYRWTRHSIYIWIVNFAVILVHIGLGVWKENTPQLLHEKGTFTWVLVAEGLVLATEFSKALSDLLVVLTLRKGHKNAFNQIISSGDGTVEDEDLAVSIGQFLKSKYTNQIKRISVLLFILTCVLVDYILIMTVRWSIEYYLPIRVFIPLMINDQVRQVASNFWETIKGAKAEIVLYTCSVFFTAIAGAVLFRESINSEEVENSYSNIIRSIVTSFIFFSTGENYTELVYDAFDSQPLYVLYFIFVTFIGTYIVMAFVLSSFVTGFTRSFQKEILKKKQYQRSGLIAAFLLLDIDQQDKISDSTLEEFYNAIWPNRMPEVAKTPKIRRKRLKLRKKFIESISDLQTFVETMEDLFEDKRVMEYNLRYYTRTGHPSQISSTRSLISKVDNNDPGVFDTELHNPNFTLRLGRNATGTFALQGIQSAFDDLHRSEANFKKRLFKYFAHPFYSQAVTFCVILQAALLTFYGLGYDLVLDALNVIFIFLYTFELTVKIYTYGLPAFLTPTDYKFERHPELNLPEYEVANRIDIIAISLSFISVIVGLGINGDLNFSDNPALRFGMAFAVLRLFSHITTVRELIFPIFMSAVARQFVSLFLLLVLVMYVFAYYGMLFFFERFKVYILLDSTPSGSFDSLTKSFLLLFQLLVGEVIIIHETILKILQGWHEVMYAGIRVQRNFVISWYFIAYIFIVTLIVTNSFISLVLAIMEKFKGLTHVTRRDVEKRMITIEE